MWAVKGFVYFEHFFCKRTWVLSFLWTTLCVWYIKQGGTTDLGVKSDWWHAILKISFQIAQLYTSSWSGHNPYSCLILSRFFWLLNCIFAEMTGCFVEEVYTDVPQYFRLGNIYRGWLLFLAMLHLALRLFDISICRTAQNNQSLSVKSAGTSP